MFCKNCGKEFPEGAKFCDACGTKLEENNVAVEEAAVENVKETEVTPVEEAPVAEAPVAEAPVEEAPVAEAPKKKKKLGKVIISAAVIVAVLGATVFASFPYVKNFVEKTFSSPEKYYQNVEERSVNEIGSAIADVFDEIKKSGKNAEENLNAINNGKATKSEFDGKKISADLSLTLGDSIIELLNAESNMDLDVFRKIGIGFDMSEKDGLAALGAKLSLSDGKIISANVTATEDAEIYAELPELSDTAMKMDILRLLGFDSLEDIYSLPEYKNTFEKSFALINALPDGETAEKIISRYAEVILAEIDNVDKYSEKVSVGEIKVNATCLEAEIDEKTLASIVLAAIREFEDDDELHDIVDAFMAATGESEKGEFKKYLKDAPLYDNAKDVMDDAFEGFGEIVIKTYVNAKGEVLGHEIEYQDSTISAFYVTKGKKTAFELDVEAEGSSVTILGEGTLKNGIFNGEATLEAMSIDVAKIEIVDFDTENAFNGTLILHPSKTIASMLSEYETDDVSSLLGISIDSLGIDLSKLSLEVAMENSEDKGSFSIDFKSDKNSIVKIETKCNVTDAEKIKLPEKSIEVADEIGLMSWIGTLDIDGFTSSLPEEVMNILTLITESGILGSEDDYYYDEDSYSEEDYYNDYYRDEDGYGYESEYIEGADSMFDIGIDTDYVYDYGFNEDYNDSTTGSSAFDDYNYGNADDYYYGNADDYFYGDADAYYYGDADAYYGY